MMNRQPNLGFGRGHFPNDEIHISSLAFLDPPPVQICQDVDGNCCEIG